MLKFELFSDDKEDRHIYINPLAVASVTDTSDRHAYGGWSEIAVIRMLDGTTHKVYDGARQVGAKIQEAQEAWRAKGVTA